MLKPLSVLLCAMALVLAACGDDEDQPADQKAAAAPPAEEQAGCKDVEQPTPREDGGQNKPQKPLDPAKAYEVELQTSCGAFTIRLDQKTSPKAAASFAALASSGFFDDTIFHRIVPGFVIQGGDPTATGQGDPGYSTVDEPPADARYIKGVVAMAKSEAEPPGTAGSQFFVVTADDAGLPPDYAVIGTVTEGMEVVDRIAVLGDPNTQLPTQPVVLDEMEVRILDG